MIKRDVITIDDLSNEDIEDVFALADYYLTITSDDKAPHRVAKRVPPSKESAEGRILASLFYEPSTRTRLSFESAMTRLGGSSLTVSGGNTTSAAKGETIADTVRVIENYADIIVLRHPCEGAARTAADLVSIPVINGGDGGHEHPTQTLCDLYTLKREKKSLEGISVLLTGDLKNGRTVHSLVYGLARFGAVIATAPAPGLGLPEHVSERLKREYKCVPVSSQVSNGNGSIAIDAVYVTPKRPHQPTLFSISVDVNVRMAEAKRVAEEAAMRAQSLDRSIDVFYVTRIQKERGSEVQELDHGVPVIDKAFLSGKRYKDAKVLHPLPRVHELGYDIDSDPRSVYFKQAGYGVPIRMALIAKLLGIRPFRPTTKVCALDTVENGAWLCENPGCISNSEEERRAITPRFCLLAREPVVLQCRYCEHIAHVRAIGCRGRKTLSRDVRLKEGLNVKNFEFFKSVEQGVSAGYHEAFRNKVHHDAV